MGKTKTITRSKGTPTVGARSSEPHPGRDRRAESLVCEIAWEVCNQVGGIYTVLRSKVPSMMEMWGKRYVMVGPYNHATASVEFEPAPLVGPVGQAVEQMRNQGVGAHLGRWLVTGRPMVVLLDHLSIIHRLAEIKYQIWEHHQIDLPKDDELINNVVVFGELVRQFLSLVAFKEASRRKIVAHFHEWMGGVAIPMLRHDRWPGAIVFTTHATLVGRYLAMNDSGFYDHLPYYDGLAEARKYDIEPQHRLESAAAHGSHVFTTVSDVTGEECRHLLGRSPDVLVPNGLNKKRFSSIEEFQSGHRENKEKIHRFVMGHFFPSYHFDLDKTLYFFTSGRYEYRNKGMDLTIEALARLNHKMRQSDRAKEVTVVAFIVTRRPFKSINVGALQSSAMLDELQTVVDAMKEQVGERLLHAAATGEVPILNELVDEYWRLRLRRTIHAWKRIMPPSIVTHDLVDDAHDEVLNQLRSCRLWNNRDDPVKVIYHPDFISPTNPLWGIEYEQFVHGCNLGIFPSYYEPWGYTPLESIVLGVPAVASDLSGFGSYVTKLLPRHNDEGMFVLERRYKGFGDSAEALANYLLGFTEMNRRERVTLRNTVEAFSENFDWQKLSKTYHEAHNLAMDRIR